MSSTLPAPIIMGILNVTPDSFSDGGQHHTLPLAQQHIRTLLAEGASIIDIGGESTRPSSTPISPTEELSRISAVIQWAKSQSLAVSVDTYHEETIRAVIPMNVDIINDVDSDSHLETLMEAALLHDLSIIIMHNSRKQSDFGKHHSATYEVMRYFETVGACAEKIGLPTHRLILDVGIGFGKTFTQELELVEHTQEITSAFPYDFLGAVSRKSFIQKKIACNDRPAVIAESARVAAYLYHHGCRYLRVHDVAQTLSAIHQYHE